MSANDQTPTHAPRTPGGASGGSGTPGGSTPGGPRLVVRNTFLEVFDDPPLEAEGAQQRRPRAQTDITDAKMPRKVSYPMDGQEQNYYGAYGLPPHLGGIPEDMMSPGLRPMMPPTLGPPGGFPAMPGYGFPPWGFPGVGPGGMPPPFPGMPGMNMPPWGFPPMVPPSMVPPQQGGGGRGGGQGRRQAEKGSGKQRGEKGGGKSDQGGRGRGGGNAGGGGGGQGGGGGGGHVAMAPAPKGLRGGETEAAQSPAQVVERHQNGTETTVMLRNIPNRYTQSMLLNLLDEHAFKHAYDFVYLPMDFRNGVNLGYAFVNLANNEEALRVMNTFQGFSRWYFDSAKVCEVSWAHPHQGLHEHVERYRNSPVMHPSMPEEYKPMIFKDGERVTFPLPTKAIRAPKLRPVHDRPGAGTGQDGAPDMGTSL